MEHNGLNPLLLISLVSPFSSSLSPNYFFKKKHLVLLFGTSLCFLSSFQMWLIIKFIVFPLIISNVVNHKVIACVESKLFSETVDVIRLSSKEVIYLKACQNQSGSSHIVNEEKSEWLETGINILWYEF